jgi:hypothetical protein
VSETRGTLAEIVFESANLDLLSFLENEFYGVGCRKPDQAAGSWRSFGNRPQLSTVA